MLKVSVVGGGTGIYAVLAGLKKYPIDLNAIVCVTDSGGSTGRLRDEFGNLPVGDFRMALVALSPEDVENNLMRKLFMYRFEKGRGLEGHNFGNLLLTALTEILGSQEKTISTAEKILNIRGSIVPITYQKANLQARYEDGTTIIGETNIDEPELTHNPNLRITTLSTKPKTQIQPKAKKLIESSDYIIFGPGDLYTSVLANIVVGGTNQALIKSKARKIFVLNLVTKKAQTTNFKASDFIEEFKKYAGCYPDLVLINNKKLPEKVVKIYQKDGEFPVIDDYKGRRNLPFRVVRTDLLSDKKSKKTGSDHLKRSLLRHDPEKISKALMRIFLS